MTKKISNDEGIVNKLDFEKAFDCVDWGFLIFVMEKKGFGVQGIWMYFYGDSCDIGE